MRHVRNRNLVEKTKTANELRKLNNKRRKQERKKIAELAKLGITYSFPGLVSQRNIRTLTNHNDVQTFLHHIASPLITNRDSVNLEVSWECALDLGAKVSNNPL